MRHLKRKRNLGMSPSHRSSLLANLAVSILDKEHIITTIAKAKEVRGVVERLITYGKTGGLHAMRLAGKTIHDKTLLHKLFTDIAPSFKDRVGGYTRIIKLNERKGDNALCVIIELVGRGAGEIARNRKKQKKQPSETSQTKSTKSDAAQHSQKEEAASPALKPPKTKKEKPKAKAAETSEEKNADKKNESPSTTKPKKVKKEVSPEKKKDD
jgi:large subunit ribosomal protein L17